MKVLNILCEGPTEENFVKKVLSPYLKTFHLIVKVRQVTTNRKMKVTGGMTNYPKIKKDFDLWVKENSRDSYCQHYYTCMFDYYQLPTDFPGFPPIGNEAIAKARHLENELATDLNIPSFVPYIQLHEFEALVFAGIEYLIADYPDQEKAIRDLNEVLKQCNNNPEEINNHPNTAPSKRLITALGKYNKTKSGPMVAERVGIFRLKMRCPHFKEWIEKLELLSKE